MRVLIVDDNEELRDFLALSLTEAAVDVAVAQSSADAVLKVEGERFDAIIIDFGGFLGIGTKPVAVAYENLSFLADTTNNRSLVLPITRDQMDAAPAFDRDTYVTERNTQRTVVAQP